jgi:hypothetical protein
MDERMNSPGRRENILSSHFRELGVGFVHDTSDVAYLRTHDDGNCTADGTFQSPLFHYWTQNFGARSSVYPVAINLEAFSTAIRNVDLYFCGSGWAQDLRIRNEIPAGQRGRRFRPMSCGD